MKPSVKTSEVPTLVEIKPWPQSTLMTGKDCYLTWQPEFFRALIWDFVGYTYPKATWERRLQALTTKDKLKIAKLEKRLHDLLEEIDVVVSNRAEANKDPWP